MQNKIKKILVVFVEPMYYILDLIREVYQKTDLEFKFVFAYTSLTGKDDLILPDNSVVLEGNEGERKAKLNSIFDEFAPDFA